MKYFYSSRNTRSLRAAPTAAALTLTAALLVGCTSQSGTAEEVMSSQSTGGTIAQSEATQSGTAQPATTLSFSTGPGDTVASAMENNHSFWVPKDGGEGDETGSITLTGASATATSDNVKINGSTVTITAAGTYEVSGNLSGQLVVDAPDTAQVKLILKNVAITNSSEPAVLLSQADGVVLELAEGSSNMISDTATFAEDAEENAALFSRVDLQISGEGSLEVSGQGEDGIASKDDLVITSGNLKVTATDDGIRGKDALVITGGNIEIVAGGDGLKTTNEDDVDRGYFLITGGNVTISAGSDGIDSVRDALFDGGSVLITESEEGVEAQRLLIGGGTLDITSSDDGLNATAGSISTTDAASMAGVATTQTANRGPAGDTDDGSVLHIYGGKTTINAEGDGIDSNGSLTISGGEVTVFGTSRGGNGAFDANGLFTLNGGEVLALSAGQMEQGPSEVTQALVESSLSGTAGQTVGVSVSGHTMAEVQAVKTFGYVFCSSASLNEGELVSISTGTSTNETAAALASSSSGMGPGGIGGPGEGGPGGGVPGGDGTEPPARP